MNISSVSGGMMNQAVFAMSHRDPTVSGMNLAELSEDDAQLMYAAQKFEGYFLQMMFRAMRDTVNTENGILPQTETQRIFQDMMDEQIAINAANGGGMGLAQQIFNQMTAHRNFIQAALVNDGAYSYYGRDTETL